MNKKDLDGDLDGIYLSPDLHKMYRLKSEQEKAKSSRYAILISAGSLLIATISLVVAIMK